MDLLDDDVRVYVARTRTPDGTSMTSWSASDKARG
jgi:hypothetical protein